jgi:CheY-like chemotaxis protein
MYDLLLVDINMLKMDSLEFSAKILEQDINVRICLVTAKEINIDALREQFTVLKPWVLHEETHCNR